MPGANTSSQPSPNNENWASSLPPWAIWTSTLIALLVLPAAILDLFMMTRYLPSVEWLHTSRPAAYGLMLIWSLAILLFIGQSNGSIAKRIFISVGCIAIFSSTIGDLVRSGVPALVAKGTGAEVQHTYTVIRADGPSDKFCRTPIELEGMPFMTKLCGTGNEFRNHLSPGQTVTFGGTGTSMGLYVGYMLKSDSTSTTLPRPRPPR